MGGSERPYVKLKSGIENKHRMFSLSCELQRVDRRNWKWNSKDRVWDPGARTDKVGRHYW